MQDTSIIYEKQKTSIHSLEKLKQRQLEKLFKQIFDTGT